jgi:hypothetical protein
MASRLKIVLASLAMSAAITVGACTDQQTAETIAQVQKNAQLACSFVPTAASVANILAALYPAAQAPVGAATAVAQQICGAVTAKSAHRGAALAPTVAGVVVEGHFVR